MKAIYKFSTGDYSEVEVTGSLEYLIKKIEADTFNSNRKETRRHESYNKSGNLNILADKSVDIEAEFIKEQTVQSLYNAISKLKPSEINLICKLYLNESTCSQAEIARELGISETAVWKRSERIRKKLRNLMVEI